MKLFSPLLEQKAKRAITRKTITLSLRNIAAAAEPAVNIFNWKFLMILNCHPVFTEKIIGEGFKN